MEIIGLYFIWTQRGKQLNHLIAFTLSQMKKIWNMCPILSRYVSYYNLDFKFTQIISGEMSLVSRSVDLAKRLQSKNIQIKANQLTRLRYSYCYCYGAIIRGCVSNNRTHRIRNFIFKKTNLSTNAKFFR